MAIDTVGISQYSSFNSAESSNYSLIKGGCSTKAASRKKTNNKMFKSPYITTESGELLHKVNEKKTMKRKEFISSAKSPKSNSERGSAKKQKKSVLTLPNAETPTPKEWTVSDNNESYFSADEQKEKTKRIVYSAGNKQRNNNNYYVPNSETGSSTVNTVRKRKPPGLNKKHSDKKDLSKVWSVLKDMNKLQFRTSPAISIDEEVTTQHTFKARCRSSNSQKNNRTMKSCETEELIYVSIQNIKTNDFSTDNISSDENKKPIGKDLNKTHKTKINENIMAKHLRQHKKLEDKPFKGKEAINNTNIQRTINIKERGYDNKKSNANKYQPTVPITSCNVTNPNQSYEINDNQRGDCKLTSKINCENLKSCYQVGSQSAKETYNAQNFNTRKLSNMKENPTNDQSNNLYHNQIKTEEYQHRNGVKNKTIQDVDNYNKSNLCDYQSEHYFNSKTIEDEKDQKIIKEFLKRSGCYVLDKDNRTDRIKDPHKGSKILIDNNEANYDNRLRVKSAMENALNGNVKTPINSHSKSVRYSSCNISTASPISKYEKPILEENEDKKHERTSMSTAFCKPIMLSQTQKSFETNNTRYVRSKSPRRITRHNSNDSCNVAIDEFDNYQQDDPFSFELDQSSQYVEASTKKKRTRKPITTTHTLMSDSEDVMCHLDHCHGTVKVSYNSGKNIKDTGANEKKKDRDKSPRKIKSPCGNLSNRNGVETSTMRGYREIKGQVFSKNTENKTLTSLNDKKHATFKTQVISKEEECMTVIALNNDKNNRRQQLKNFNFLKDKLLKILSMQSSSSCGSDQMSLDTFQASLESSESLNHMDAFTETTFKNLCCKSIENVNSNSEKYTTNKEFSKNKWSKGKWTSEFIDHVLSKLNNGFYYNYESDKCDGDHKNATVQTTLTIDRSKIKEIQIEEKPDIDTNQTNAIVVNNASHETLKTLLSFNNVLSNLEVTLNSDQIEVKHPMTDTVVKFDVSLNPGKDKEDANLITSNYIPYTTNNQTRFFKSSTMIVNDSLPASICSLLPIMINNILLNKNVVGEQWRIGDQITSPLLTIPEMSQKDKNSIFQNGRYSNVLKRDKMSYKINENCLNEFQRTDIFGLLQKPQNIVSVTQVKSDIRMLEVKDRDNGRMYNPVKSCPDFKNEITEICPIGVTSLQSRDNYWVSCVKRFLGNRRTISMTEIMNHFTMPRIAKSMPQLKIIYSQTNSQFLVQILIGDQNGTTIAADLKNVTCFAKNSVNQSIIVNKAQDTSRCVEYNESEKFKNYKRLRKQHQDAKKLKRFDNKTNAKLRWKFESKKKVSETLLSKVKTLKDFFKVIGTNNSLARVIESHSAKKIMNFVSEMSHWVSKITPRQALLILLLANKKGTVNLIRLHSVIVHAIAVNRITNTRELEEEIEIIEKEKLGVNVEDRDLTFLEAEDSENNLMEELYLIAKNAASDANKTFDETPENFLNHLVRKRKSLNPSYLRVMARYIGLGLVKICAKT